MQKISIELRLLPKVVERSARKSCNKKTKSEEPKIFKKFVSILLSAEALEQLNSFHTSTTFLPNSLKPFSLLLTVCLFITKLFDFVLLYFYTK